MKTILVGNDINNIGGGISWEQLLNEIVMSVQLRPDDIEIMKEKPFPLLYEEIFLKAKKLNPINEIDLKRKIADLVNKLEPNLIHHEIVKLNFANIITTNYEYSFQKCVDTRTENIKNAGHVKEQKYSVFRHNYINNTKIWHIHGESNIPNSITLGYEHYGGQLQNLRTYVVSGSNYNSSNINKQSLYTRIKNNIPQRYSWADCFYLDDVYIIGIQLGFEETDLWWLLTNRARFFLDKNDHKIPMNKIIYYSPAKYKNKAKDDILNANCVETKYIDDIGGAYYGKVLKELENLKQ